MTTTIFNYGINCSENISTFIYSVDEERVIESLDEYNNLPIPLPSHMYIRITNEKSTVSYFWLDDNERKPFDIPEDNFWLIENIVNSAGKFIGKMIIQPDKIPNADRKPPYNSRTYFRLTNGKDYQIVYNGKTILKIEPQQCWKIDSFPNLSDDRR